MIKSIIKEYGIEWCINRGLYSSKLKIMRKLPIIENLFEKKVDIKRLDIFELDIEDIKSFLINLSDEDKHNLIEIANKAIEGKIQAFSSIELDYGNPINWHYNPITKKQVEKTQKWYSIPDFDKERGDIKVIWEISRFTHLYYISRAFLITEDIKYYKAFSNQMKSWLEENEYSYGSNYKCGQEAALRMINILMAYSVFNYYNLITKSDEINILKIVEGSYKKIISNFFYAHKCIKNNHTFSEICGLIIGAWCCNDFKGIAKSYKLLDKEIKKQFMDDGGYIQFSFNYQRFVLQIIECIIKISEKTGINISNENKERILQSVYLMYQVQDKSGDLPNYGSNDGALIFPVTICGYRDFRPVLNTLYCLIKGNRLYTDGDYDEELLWFGKKENLKYDVITIDKESKSFSDAGIYTIRDNNVFMMILLQEYKTRPAQMDTLHIDMWYKNRNIFCDSGTYSYATEIGKELSLTSAHNTVKVNDREQMKKHGPFMIYDWVKTKDIKHTNQSFKGTMISKNKYSHTRTITRKDMMYYINDFIEGEGNYCEVYLHTPFQVKVVEQGVEIFDLDEILCTVEVNDAEILINKQYRSLYYLKKEEINCICIRKNIIDRKSSIQIKIHMK